MTTLHLKEPRLNPPLPDDERLYLGIADRIAGLIDTGTLRVGQRVPSVRTLSGQWHVSISTVLAAYRVLEDRGRIEARPQSGFYVRGAMAPVCKEPCTASKAPPMAPSKVRVTDLVTRILTAAVDPEFVRLGGAVPMDDTLPTKQLNRLSAAIARRSRRGNNTYDIPPGNKELRVQVARRYVEAGCALSPDELITTCGCQEAVTLCLRAAAKAGDVVAIESPTFYGHLQAIEALGMRAVEVPCSPTDGVSIEALEKAIRQRKVKACLCVTNVQNPLGCIMPDERKAQLVKMLARHRVPLIEDDIYGDLAYGPSRPGVCKALDREGLVMLCSSFSKTLAPGARVGWCAPGRFFDDVLRLKICTTLATATLPQMMIAEFLANGGYQHHLRKTRLCYAHQVQMMSAAVQKYFPGGTRVSRPAGGHVVWVEMPERVDAMKLYERAAELKISIAPGPIFSARGRFKNCLRLNCSAAWTDQIERAVATLGDLAKE